MSRNHTVLIIDGDYIKIVFGNKLKCIKFSDVGLDYNSDFLDAIFYNTEVVRVDNISRISREDFDQFIATKGATRTEASYDTYEEHEDIQAIRQQAPINRTPPRPSRQRPVPDPVPSGPRRHPAPAPASLDRNSFIVSLDERMTIIVEDVKTGRRISRGATSEEESLVLEPGKPVNLGTLEKKSVKDSFEGGTLSKLMRAGTVRQVSNDEAMKMLQAYEARTSQVLSVHDWEGSIIGDGRTGSAERMASNMFDENSDIETIEISEQSERGAMRRARVGMQDATADAPTLNEDSQSLWGLMDILDEAESKGELRSQKNVYNGFRAPGGA